MGFSVHNLVGKTTSYFISEFPLELPRSQISLKSGGIRNLINQAYKSLQSNSSHSGNRRLPFRNGIIQGENELFSLNTKIKFMVDTTQNKSGYLLR